MNPKVVIPALVIAAGVATAGSLAYAGSSRGENDAAELAKAKISLTQAVNAAEAQANGRATRAELEDENGRIVYGVEIVTADGKALDVKVDAVDGKVVSSQPDQGDRGREGENEHEEE